ncbi:MAG: VOC family protein [Propionibacteriales bacterium]|nr:VOC family protein [Propionibacteriales bacterium]
MAIARNPQFVLDCPDPVVLAEFYGAILGWAPKPDPDGGWATITSGDRAIHFQRVEGFEPPEWPGQGRPQQVHLDVDVDDLDEGEGAVLALGAVKHEHQPGTTFRVYLDPAGHPFCLCQV